MRAFLERTRGKSKSLLKRLKGINSHNDNEKQNIFKTNNTKKMMVSYLIQLIE